MVAALARQLDQLQQPLLERVGPQLDRAEDDLWAGVGPAGRAPLLVELVGVVGDEVAALPVAVEHGGELGDDVGVAGCRGPHVPLEPGHLRRVGEVRRADVGGREAGPAVEDPRLGVQARRAEVVGDAHLGAEVDELVERRGARSSRCRSSSGPATARRPRSGGAGVEQRGDPAAPDEGHHDVDRVGRLDLRAQLVPQRRVRPARWSAASCRAAGSAARRSARACRRGCGGGARAAPSPDRPERAAVRRHELAQAIEERSGHPKPDPTRSSSLTSSRARSIWRLTCQAIRSEASALFSGRSLTTSGAARQSSTALKPSVTSSSYRPGPSSATPDVTRWVPPVGRPRGTSEDARKPSPIAADRPVRTGCCMERSAEWLRNARWGAGRCGWHHDSMAEPVRNRRSTVDLDDEDVEGAIERMAGRDLDRGRDAEHVYDTLTWGEGPSRIDQAGVQRWLWYELPTKYMTDEPGYMTRLAAVAAELFDELGLGAYAEICRSQVTAGVHAAFDRSRGDGFAAMRKALASSGIDPPDLDSFAWGQVMGTEEAMARRRRRAPWRRRSRMASSSSVAGAGGPVSGWSPSGSSTATIRVSPGRRGGQRSSPNGSAPGSTRRRCVRPISVGAERA